MQSQSIAGSNRLAPTVFVALVAIVYALALLIRFELITTQRPDLLATAITLDLTLFLPLMFYVLVVRQRGWHATSTIPVIILSTIAAGFVLPANRQHALDVIHLLLVPLELIVLSVVAWKGHQTYRHLKRIRAAGPVDAYAALQVAVKSFTNQPLVQKLLAFELSVIYYGVFAWRRQPLAPSTNDECHFSVHQKCGYLTVLIAIQIAMCVELIGVHYLVHTYWNTIAAWIVSALSLYGILWLWADWNAIRLRPTILNSDRLLLRVGFRWQVEIDHEQIVSVVRLTGMDALKKDKSQLDVSLLGGPNVEVRVSDPVEVQGPYGITRQAECIRLYVDAPDEFVSRLTSKEGPQ